MPRPFGRDGSFRAGWYDVTVVGSYVPDQTDIEQLADPERGHVITQKIEGFDGCR